MKYLSDSKRAAAEDGSTFFQNLTDPPRRRPQKKMLCVIILISTIVLILLAIPIILLYHQTSNLSLQLETLQAKNINLQAQLTAFQDSITQNLTGLENSLINTQCGVQSLNQSFITVNITRAQLGNSLSATQSEVQSLNQNLTALGTSANASIASLKIETTPTFLNYVLNSENYTQPLSVICGGGFVLVPETEFSISSQNGGYGICDFTATQGQNFWIQSSFGIDGTPGNSTDPFGSKDYLMDEWTQNFQFSAGNHTISVMIALPINPPSPYDCTPGYTRTVFFSSVRFICTLYGVESNN